MSQKMGTADNHKNFRESFSFLSHLKIAPIAAQEKYIVLSKVKLSGHRLS